MACDPPQPLHHAKRIQHARAKLANDILGIEIGYHAIKLGEINRLGTQLES